MYKKCFLIVIIALLLCSCGENLEVRERGFVQGMGISKDDKVNVCLRVFEEMDKTKEYRGTGDTLEDAINDAEMTQGKDFFAGNHCNIKDNPYLCALEREKNYQLFN